LNAGVILFALCFCLHLGCSTYAVLR
jgi:hypothetical protein